MDKVRLQAYGMECFCSLPVFWSKQVAIEQIYICPPYLDDSLEHYRFLFCPKIHWPSVVGMRIGCYGIVTIVVMIERQILLAIHPTNMLATFRLVIAIVMAIVGSTIFDQTMFGKDINKQMADTIESYRRQHWHKGIIDGKLTAINTEKDSLDKLNSILQADINANP